MAVSPTPKRKSERLNRRKLTLINKAHELAEFCDIDVALIIRSHKSGQYFIYNSLDLESWPLSKEQIVSHRLWLWRSERTLLTEM
jgi:SRF-type transcription factor (DNA-binding and dimerisation domain)